MQEKQTKEEILRQLKYGTTSLLGDQSTPEAFESVLSNIAVTESTLIGIHRLREILIEQKAYHQFSLDSPNLYRDVAADSSLWGQIQLLDAILKLVKVSS